MQTLYIYPHMPTHLTHKTNPQLFLSFSLSMDAPHQLSSLTCNLTIMQAKNVDFNSTGTLFVRYYLSAGNNKRIRLNTREISSKSDLCWNESFSLDCFGSQDSMDSLKQENVVFELRRRNKVPVLGRIGGSQLLGRVEIPWKEVCESPNMEMVKWVPMGHVGVSKPPKLQVGMKVQVPAMEEMGRRRNGNVKKWDDECCGCKDFHGYSCEDYDIFALAAAF